MQTTTGLTEVTPDTALDVLRSRILVDGFHLVMDPQANHDSYMHDAVTGEEYLDFYAFFASQPITFNHPRMREPAFQANLLTAATTKVANSDVYTRFYAQFVKTLDEVARLDGMEHFFFIDGGGLAVENALKAAFDWKVRKNLAAGRGEIGSRVIHFRQAFHGRTGYTMSLTNTDPNKVMYFPKFDWPRIDNPCIDFSLPEPQRTEDVATREAAAVAQIEQAVEQHGHDIACLIIEPIQGEGGDNHFRPEFMQELRRLCDQHEMLLIFDEVQTGVGLTGKMWACEHSGVSPDILAFGKKMQICGIMSTTRVDEVDGVFKVPSRINSTWGGNLADMVRSTQYLKIIHEDDLVARAAESGQHLLEGLQSLAAKHDAVTAVRGLGLMCAFDLPTTEQRNAFLTACREKKLLTLACGDRTIRFRPVLDVSDESIDSGLEILDTVLAAK